MFTQETQNKAARYNLSPRDVLFAQLIAAGADKGDAYSAIYHQTKTKTHEAAKTYATDHIKNNPGLTLLINQFKRTKPQNTTTTTEQTETEEQKEKKEEKRKELATRAGILKNLADICEQLQGKEQLQALQLLAKMQGLDKPDEQEEEEKRVYFLPWVSNCRSCALMEIYKKNQAKKEG